MEDLEQIKSKVDILQYIQQRHFLGKGTVTASGTLYKNCPICGSKSPKASDKGHFLVNEKTQSYSSFTHCCKGGDILNFIEESKKLDFQEAKEELYRITNTPLQYDKPDFSQEEVKKEKKTQSAEELKTINDFITQGFNDMQDKEELIKYLNKRHISQNAIDKYHLFISNDTKGNKRIYIPIYENGTARAYIGRALENKEEVLRYNNSKGSIQPFNLDYIKNKADADATIYICEGVFDSISIEEQGKKAISLNSTQNKSKLIEAIKENISTAKEYLYIIATDNDEAGQRVKEELQVDFSKLNIKSTYLKIPSEYKDVNEWYCKTQRETFCDILEQSIYNKYTDKTLERYISNYYLTELENFCNCPVKKTGFKFLDSQLGGGIKSGLYVIGAVPSLGKTTFTLQVADNIAKQGNKVIIFSLEQSRFELVSKAISRLTWERKPADARSHNAIMQNKNIDQVTVDAITEYVQTIAQNEIIEEGNFETSVDTIRAYIQDYVASTNERPTVVVDYLQILAPSNPKFTDKMQVDYNITTLKRISRDYGIPVIVISSFNRTNYSQTASFEQFKESGGIEYTADVLLTMQLKLLEDEKKHTGQEIAEAKKQTKRELQVVCLKNRSGQSNYSIDFEFNPVFNYFKEKPNQNKDIEQTQNQNNPLY